MELPEIIRWSPVRHHILTCAKSPKPYSCILVPRPLVSFGHLVGKTKSWLVTNSSGNENGFVAIMFSSLSPCAHASSFHEQPFWSTRESREGWCRHDKNETPAITETNDKLLERLENKFITSNIANIWADCRNKYCLTLSSLEFQSVSKHNWFFLLLFIYVFGICCKNLEVHQDNIPELRISVSHSWSPFWLTLKFNLSVLESNLQWVLTSFWLL